MSQRASQVTLHVAPCRGVELEEGWGDFTALTICTKAHGGQEKKKQKPNDSFTALPGSSVGFNRGGRVKAKRRGRERISKRTRCAPAACCVSAWLSAKPDSGFSVYTAERFCVTMLFVFVDSFTDPWHLEQFLHRK